MYIRILNAFTFELTFTFYVKRLNKLVKSDQARFLSWVFTKTFPSSITTHRFDSLSIGAIKAVNWCLI